MFILKQDNLNFAKVIKKSFKYYIQELALSGANLDLNLAAADLRSFFTVEKQNLLSI